MYDVQMIAIQDKLPVLFVDYDLTLPVPTLILRGEDFRSVSEVLVNTVRSPSFVVLSDSSMMAEIPSSQVSARIRSVDVLSNSFTATARSLISFRLASTGKGVAGIERLVQKFIRTFFTTPGTDMFNQSAGGGALSIIGTATSKYSSSSATGAFALAVDGAAEEIIKYQNMDSRIPSDEKLATADLIAVDYNPNTGTLAGRVKIVSVAGEDALLNLFPNE